MEGTRMTPMTLFSFDCSSVFIVDFEQVNAGWGYIKLDNHNRQMDEKTVKVFCFKYLM